MLILHLRVIDFIMFLNDVLYLQILYVFYLRFISFIKYLYKYILNLLHIRSFFYQKDFGTPYELHKVSAFESLDLYYLYVKELN